MNWFTKLFDQSVKFPPTHVPFKTYDYMVRCYNDVVKRYTALVYENEKLNQAYEDFNLDAQLQKAKARSGIPHNIVSVFSILVQKPKVCVVVEDNKTGHTGFGVAKCGKNDAFNQSRGMNIALARAVRDLKEALDG